MLEVTIFNPTGIVFKGQAKSVILPGEAGVFEVLPFHRRMVSLLKAGEIDVDGRMFPVASGVARVYENQVVVVAEEPLL